MKKRHLPIFLVQLFLGLILSNAGFAQIVNIEDKRASAQDSIPWKVTSDLNFSWIKNTRNILNLGGKLRVEYNHGKNSMLSLSAISYVIIDDKKFVNSGFEHLRYNRVVKGRLIYEAFVQSQFNEQLLLNLRLLFGTGIRFQLNKKVNNPCFIGLSYMYEYDEENQGEVFHRDHRLSNYLALKTKISEQVQFYSTTYYQPLATNFKDYRLSTQNNLIFGLSQSLKLNLSFSLIFDSRAPVGAPKTTHQLKMGLRILV